MTNVQFDHLELTVPRGWLTKDARAEIDEFWCGVFGWSSNEHLVGGESCHMLRPDPDRFLLLVEADEPFPPSAQDISEEPGEFVFVSHLGVLCESNDDVDHLLDQSRRFQEKDPRVRIKDYPLYTWGGSQHHNFLVSYLIPIWFDVHWSGEAAAENGA